MKPFSPVIFYSPTIADPQRPGAVLDGVIKKKRRKRPQKQTEFQFFLSLAGAANNMLFLTSLAL
jgi:hypothetical protein